MRNDAEIIVRSVPVPFVTAGSFATTTTLKLPPAAVVSTMRSLVGTMATSAACASPAVVASTKAATKKIRFIFPPLASEIRRSSTCLDAAKAQNSRQSRCDQKLSLHVQILLAGREDERTRGPRDRTASGSAGRRAVSVNRSRKTSGYRPNRVQ